MKIYVTHRNQSIDQSNPTGSVGSPMAVRTRSKVTKPALGMAAAPMLAMVAVILKK